jgi:hypothetical protein
MKIDFELARGSKEAHQVSIDRLVQKVGAVALELMDAKGYSVSKATTSGEISYVRHVWTHVLRKPVVRRLKKVS